MSDISAEQMDDLIQAMSKSAGSLGKIADKFGTSSSGKANARDQLQKDFTDARKEDTKQTKDHFAAIKTATSAVKTYAANILEIALVTSVFKEIIKYGTETVETYRDLSNHGQSFGGSMIKMSQAAASAGLPLKTFAEAVRHNSVVFSQMGQSGPGSFASVSKQLRVLTESSGLYGMTVKDLNDFALDYIDIQRTAGKNVSATSAQGVASIAKFALGITGISDVLGAEREVVMANTKKLLQEDTVVAAQRLNTVNGMDAYNEGLKAAVADLAAQPGKGGEMLSQGLAEAFGNTGGALFTDLGKKLNSVGQGGATMILDEANQRIKAGEDAHVVAMQTVSKMKDELTNPATMESLRMLASFGGPTADTAKQLIGMASSLKTYNMQDLKRAEQARKTGDGFTQMFESFTSVMDRLKGSFLDGFLKPFTVLGKIDTTQIFKNINDLGPVLEEMGTKFGDFVSKLFTKENLDTMVATIGEIVTLGRIAARTGSFIFSALTKAIGFVHDSFMIFGKKTADIATGLSVIAAWFLGKFFIKAIVSGLGRLLGMDKVVTVSGRIVNVNGAVTGGGGGGSGGNLSKAEKAEKEAEEIKTAAKGAKAAKAVAAAEEAAAVAGKAGGKLGLLGKMGGMLGALPLLGNLGGMGGKLMSGGARLGGKALGRLGGMLIPGVGAALDFGAAANAHKEGNNLAAGLYGLGGGLNAAGAGSALTGIGAVATPFLDMAGFAASGLGLAADVTGFGKGWGKKKPTTAPAEDANAEGAMPKDAAMAGPTAAPTGGAPSVVDDDKLLQLRTDALVDGNDQTIAELKKIQEALDRHTAILASQQARNTAAVQATTSAVKATGGYAS
jgi:hypothetical protein